MDGLESMEGVKVGVFVDAAQEARQQLDGILNVVHVADLAGAVHVPQGQGM